VLDGAKRNGRPGAHIRHFVERERRNSGEETTAEQAGMKELASALGLPDNRPDRPRRGFHSVRGEGLSEELTFRQVLRDQFFAAVTETLISLVGCQVLSASRRAAGR
jgi:hypothetical protein